MAKVLLLLKVLSTVSFEVSSILKYSNITTTCIKTSKILINNGPPNTLLERSLLDHLSTAALNKHCGSYLTIMILE